MTRKCQRSFAGRGVAGILFLTLLPWLLFAAGCSDDNPLPVCDNCEDWTQVTAALGRNPDPNPLGTSGQFIAYSTIRKDQNAPDGSEEADEDVWLAWVLDRTDPSQNMYYQLTFEDLGPGDNFGPRWSPDGTTLAFVHTSPGGTFEIWQMTVGLPAGPNDPPALGVPSLVVSDARDPVWADNSSLIFSREDSLYQVDLPGGAGERLTYNPPSYTSSEDYIDRHPDVSPDGEAIFNTMGRVNVADVFVEAFEVSLPDVGGQRDTTLVEMEDGDGAWVLFQSPGAPSPSYPISSAGDTLRTPVLLRSIPVDAGGAFRIGMRLDSQFIDEEDTTSFGNLTSAYCDTTILGTWNAVPNTVDTVRAYFQVTRGTLAVTSGIAGTDIEWRRIDLKDASTSPAYAGVPSVVGNPGDVLVYDCVFTHAFTPGGQALLDSISTFIVTGQTSLGLTDTVVVRDLTPGTTRSVSLFPTARVSGHCIFDDSPTTSPPVSVVARIANTDTTSGDGVYNTVLANFEVSGLLAGLYDVLLVSDEFYFDRLIEDVAIVTAPADSESVLDVDLGDVVMNARPVGSISGTVAFADSPADPPGVSVALFKAGTVPPEPAGTAVADPQDGSFSIGRLLAGDYDVVISALGYDDLTVDDVTVAPPADTDLGVNTLIPGGFRSPVLARHERSLAFRTSTGLDVAPAAPLRAAPRVYRSHPRVDDSSAATLSEIFRAPGDVATLWRITFPVGSDPELSEILGSPAILQTPALTRNLGVGSDVRYIAYVSNDPGYWELRIQRLRDWARDGSPYVVRTPGSFDNLACTRSVTAPRWGPNTREGELHLLVTLTDCPENAFEDLEFDDQPWAQGELRVWEVLVTDY